MLSLQGNESRLKVSEFKLSTLLDITNAINNNVSEQELFVLFQYVIQHQLNIGKAVVFLHQNSSWNAVLSYGVSDDELNIDVSERLLQVNDITVMEMVGLEESKSFDIVIPVEHRQKTIAFLLLGDIDEQEMKASPIIKHLPFIQTLTNITVVAVENKRLMRESMRQEMLNKELEMAKEIQAMLLPKSLPNDDVLQVAATYRPHREVGGDFYDVIHVNENETYFCMADVSGKGMPAAILLANFQAELRTHIKADTTLESIVNALNERVWQSARGERFVTLFIAKYDQSTRELSYVNAAHPPAMLNIDGSVQRLDEGCVGMGMFAKLPFVSTGTHQLPPGAILCCFTDGVNEIEVEQGMQYVDDRLTSILESHGGDSMESLNQRILDDLNQLKGEHEFHDDVCLISCRFL